jgi:hypothetical protein
VSFTTKLMNMTRKLSQTIDFISIDTTGRGGNQRMGRIQFTQNNAQGDINCQNPPNLVHAPGAT